MELFKYPAWFFWLVAGFAALLFLYFKARAASARAAMELMAPEQLARLSGGNAAAGKRIRDSLYLAALAFLIAAAGGPQWGMEMAPVTDLNGSLAVAVDTSASMGARDLKPSRIENAKLVLNALVDKFPDYRMGIIAFSGDARVQCPLTTDSDAVKYFLSYLAPGILPVPGTDLASAITAAGDMLGKYPGQKVLVLITDGEDLEGRVDEALNSAAAANLKIFTVGLGKTEGELIPVADQSGNFTEYKKDRTGKTVVTHLDEATLLKIAQKTGAAYIRYGGDPEAAAEEIRATVGRIAMSKTRGFGKAAYKNRYRVPLAVAFLLLFVELMFMEKGFVRPKLPAGLLSRFRKTPALLLFSALALCQASPGRAQAVPPGPAGGEPGQKSWASPESLARRGNKAYADKDFPKAYDYYSKALEKSPKNSKIIFNRGAAYYRMEDYAKAAGEFEEAAKDPKLKSAADYNAGNAYYKMSDLAKAIEKYRSAIIAGPRSAANARYNLQKALEQQKQNKNQCKNPKQDRKEPEKQQKQENKNDGKDQEKKEQQDQKKEEQKKQEAARRQADKLLEMMKEKEKSSGSREMMNARFSDKPKQKEPGSGKDW
ncbi:MAG: VWA domain-containing protein [Elusimicrobiales bacterium]|jgi:Ca-activated chloride channel family protein